MPSGTKGDDILNVKEMTNKELIDEYDAVHQSIEIICCFGISDLQWRDALELELLDRGFQSENKTIWWMPDDFDDTVCPKCEDYMEPNEDDTEMVCTKCDYKRHIFPINRQFNPDGTVPPIEDLPDYDQEPEPDYKKGYHILSEYFDSISDEEKPKVDRLLKKCGL